MSENRIRTVHEGYVPMKAAVKGYVPAKLAVGHQRGYVPVANAVRPTSTPPTQTKK